MAAVHCLSCCLALPCKPRNFSISIRDSALVQASPTTFRSLSFSTNLSENAFFKGSLSLSAIERPTRRSVVCEASPKKKADSAQKRDRQAEKRRIYNKARKSEIKTRMKKLMCFFPHQVVPLE